MESIDQALSVESEKSDNFIRKLMSSLILTTKASNGLPSGEGVDDFSYYCTFPQFVKESEHSSKVISGNIHDLAWWINSNQDLSLSDDLLDPSVYEQLVDVIDNLLERADLSLDEVSQGKTKKNDKLSSVQLSLNLDKDKLLTKNSSDVPVKPQNAFLHEIDNSRETPFLPRIREKPNAVAPLELIPVPSDTRSEEEEDSGLIGPALRPSHYYKHPYEIELHQLQYQRQDIPNTPPIFPPPPIAQPFAYVDTEDSLQRAVDELETEMEIAVDLEHHSYRTFQGITCLMQISTIKKNYVIDTIKLRAHMITLQPIFTNPKILKIFHGCNSDILWLQRDFGLYVVNCFDTYQAAKILKYPALSLAHLLKYHCNIILNKKYQLSDWRQRPLPQEMVNYARDDTHYLLYIHNVLRIAVMKEFGVEGLIAVFDASKRSCLQRYEKEFFYPQGYLKLLQYANSQKKVGSSTTNIFSRSFRQGQGQGGSQASSSAHEKDVDMITVEQDLALSALWDWRDRMARLHDESVGYIMSNAELFRIGLAVPRDEATLLASCKPLSEFVGAHISEVLECISERLSAGVLSISGEKQSLSSIFAGQGAATQTMAKHPDFQKSTTRRMSGQTQRSQHDSVFTFTPAVSLSASAAATPTSTAESRAIRSVISPVPHHAGTGSQSPVMNTDEMYRMAGWKTPLSFVVDSMEVSMAAGDAVLAEPMKDVSTLEANEGTKIRLEKAIADLKKEQSGIKVTHDGEEEGEEGNLAADEDVEVGVDVVEVDEDNMLQEIPTTLNEIYEISNRNRRRNKNKKRQQGNRTDGESDGDENASQEHDHQDEDGVKSRKNLTAKSHSNSAMDTDAGVTSDHIQEFYFGKEAKKIDTGTDSMLEFLQKVQWLSDDPEQRLAVIETHLRDQAERSEGGQHAGEDRDGKTSRYPSEKRAPTTPTRGGQRHPPNSPGSRSGTAGSSQQATRSSKPPSQQTQQQPRVSQKEGFDYSQYQLGAMGAIRPPEATASGQQQAPFNPYLQAAVGPRGTTQTMPRPMALPSQQDSRDGKPSTQKKAGASGSSSSYQQRS